MARLYGYGALSNDELEQLEVLLAPIELDRTSAAPPAADTRTNPSYLVSADLFKTQRMHIGNFPQRESEITLSIVDIQTKSTTDQTMVHIGGITTFGANSLNLVGMDFAMQFNVNSKTSCTIEFLKIGDVSAANIIGSGTFTEVSMIQIHDPTTLVANITTTVGLDIQTINSATTNNFAIRTGLGLVSFGEDVTIAGNLTVTGSSPGTSSPLTLAETDSPGELLLLRNDTGIIADEALGILSFQGDEGSNLTTVVKIEGFAAETWDGSNHAAYMAFSTMNTSDSLAERMRIAATGEILVGTAVNSDGTGRVRVQLSDAAGAIIELRRSDATILSGNTLGLLRFTGDEASTPGIGAQIFASAEEDWTASAHGARLNFQTVLIGDTSATERMRITNNGLLLVGTANGISDVQAVVQGWHATGGSIVLGREDATIAANDLGLLSFAGDEGSDAYIAAQIKAVGTQTWTSTVKGAELVFFTTPDGTETLTERMSIQQGGVVIINGLGTSSDVQTGASSQLITVSDERMKIPGPKLDNVMAKIMEIEPRYYHWRDEPGRFKQLGFMAQNVHEQFPEAAPKSRGRAPDTGELIEDLHGFNSRSMLAVVVKGIQELNERLELLEVA